MKRWEKCLMVIAIILVSFWCTLALAISNGTCGENLSWTLDDEGILVISGTGKMENYTRSSFSYQIPGHWQIVYYTDSPLFDLKIQRIIINDGVTSIGNAVFSDNPSLTSVSIPASVTSIGKNSFSGCSGLTSITIPDGVTSIGDSAFGDCSGLTSITIPDGVTSIGDGTFSGCSGLTSITIPDGVTSIGKWAFCRCSGLSNINIPDGVTSIGSNAFDGCHSLTSLTIPDGVTSIKSQTFWDCFSLTSVTIPNSVTSIENSAFNTCYNLTNVIIPDGVTNIGNYAFSGCSGLTSITIPDGVTSIGDSTFSGCSGLPSITIPDGVTSIGNFAFDGCSGLTSIIIPDGVTIIGNYAFNGCSGLTSITIPDGVTSIGDNAFRYCYGLTSVKIPDSVTSIGNEAFTEKNLMFLIPSCGTYAHSWIKQNIDKYKFTYQILNQQSHQSVIDEAVSPTCEFTGLTEGAHCVKCGQMLKMQREIPKLGHEWNEPEYNWSSNNLTVTASRICKHDASHIETESVKTTVSQPASITKMSQITYEADFSNPAFAPQRKELTITAVFTLPDNLEIIENEAFADLPGIYGIRIPVNVNQIADDAFINSNVIILATEGSWAAQWAEEHGMTVVNDVAN